MLRFGRPELVFCLLLPHQHNVAQSTCTQLVCLYWSKFMVTHYSTLNHPSWLNLKGNFYSDLPQQRLFHRSFQTWWQIQFVSNVLLLSQAFTSYQDFSGLEKPNRPKNVFCERTCSSVLVHPARVVHASLLSHTLGSRRASNQTLEERVEFWKGFSLLWQCCGLV